jgi:hypothetical protein
MSPLKHTNKMHKLRELFASIPTFKGIDLNSEEMTAEKAILIAKSAGYSWSAKRQEWWLSPYRQSLLETYGSKTHNNTRMSKRVIVRIMGPLDTLARLAGDFAEVSDLIGLRAISISEAKPNDDKSSWGRIYITCEAV